MWPRKEHIYRNASVFTTFMLLRSLLRVCVYTFVQCLIAHCYDSSRSQLPFITLMMVTLKRKLKPVNLKHLAISSWWKDAVWNALMHICTISVLAVILPLPAENHLSDGFSGSTQTGVDLYMKSRARLIYIWYHISADELFFSFQTHETQ